MHLSIYLQTTTVTVRVTDSKFLRSCTGCSLHRTRVHCMAFDYIISNNVCFPISVRQHRRRAPTPVQGYLRLRRRPRRRCQAGDAPTERHRPLRRRGEHDEEDQLRWLGEPQRHPHRVRRQAEDPQLPARRRHDRLRQEVVSNLRCASGGNNCLRVLAVALIFMESTRKENLCLSVLLRKSTMSVYCRQSVCFVCRLNFNFRQDLFLEIY